LEWLSLVRGDLLTRRAFLPGETQSDENVQPPSKSLKMCDVKEENSEVKNRIEERKAASLPHRHPWWITLGQSRVLLSEQATCWEE
jgi:hypothetical protein